MQLSKRVHKTGGVTIRCSIGTKACSSFWSGPPDSIDHVGIEYIMGRYPIITTPKRASEFKKKYRALFSLPVNKETP